MVWWEGTYGAGWAFEDADLASAFFEDVIDCAHKFELDVVGLVGVVEVDGDVGNHFWGVGCGFGVGFGHGGFGCVGYDQSGIIVWRRVYGCELYGQKSRWVLF
jgi:hypothetical protein